MALVHTFPCLELTPDQLPLEAMAARFEPKVPVKLDPPKDDPIPLSELAKANGPWICHSLDA